MYTNALTLAFLVRVQLPPKLRHNLTINMSFVSINLHVSNDRNEIGLATYPHLRDIPVFDHWICGLVVPLEIDALDYMISWDSSVGKMKS